MNGLKKCLSLIMAVAIAAGSITYTMSAIAATTIPGDAVYLGSPAFPVGESKNFSAGSATTVDSTLTLYGSTSSLNAAGTGYGGAATVSHSLSGHPRNESTPAYTEFNLADKKVERFSATVGYAANGYFASGIRTNALKFTVLCYDADGNQIHKYESPDLERGAAHTNGPEYRFDNVDISGSAKLRLEVAHASGEYAAENYIWADPCVYCVHSLTHHDAVAPTKTADGNIEYWDCEKCGHIFADADGIYYFSDPSNIIDPAVKITVPGDAAYLGSPAAPLGNSKNYSAGSASTIDKTLTLYGKTAELNAAKSGYGGAATYTHSVCGHPQNASTPAFSEFDISGVTAKWFHATVGFAANGYYASGVRTNAIKFIVLGYDADGKQVCKYESLELERGLSHTNGPEYTFNADISGAVKLRLEVAHASGTYAAEDYIWADACVFCEHSLKEHEEKNATVSETGNIHYYECEICGRYFEDDEAKKYIEDKNAVIIPVLEHDPELVPAVPPTTEKEGSKAYYKCRDCEKIFADDKCINEITDKSTLVIPKLSSYKVMFGGPEFPVTESQNYKACSDTVVKYGAVYKFYGASTTLNGKKTGWENAAEYQYGLLVHPVDEFTPGYSLFDLRNYKVDTFNATVGFAGNGWGPTGALTNELSFKVIALDADQNPISGKTYESGNVKRGTEYEFNVDISDAVFLRLEVSHGSGLYGNSDSAWANACVFDSKHEHVIQPVPAKAATDSEPGSILYYECKVCGKPFYDEAGTEEITDMDSVVIPPLKAARYYVGSDDVPVLNSANRSGKGATVVNLDKEFKFYGTTAKLNDKKTGYGESKAYTNGLQVHPVNVNTPGYTVLDLSGVYVDTFHALVGFTSNGWAEKGALQNGLNFRVIALDKNGKAIDGKTYESGTVKRGSEYEFNVNIKGAASLRLEVKHSSGTYGNSDSAWADAYVYLNEHTHQLKKVNAKKATTLEDGNIAYWTCQICGKYFKDAQGKTEIKDKYSVIIPKLTGYPEAFGGYSSASTAFCKTNSSVKYISDMKFDSYIMPKGGSKEARTATKDKNFSGASIALGKYRINFAKGLGVVPSLKTSATPASITIDLTGLDVDRFYSAVGITGTASNKSSPNSKYGVAFYVYGMKDEDEGFYPIACSGRISLTNAGEFMVDISGLKAIKLVTVSLDQYNYGCDSAWGNACLFNSKKTSLSKFDSTSVFSEGTYKGTNAKDENRIFLSDLTYDEGSNYNVGSKQKKTVNDHPYGEPNGDIIIGSINNECPKGLGVHPSGVTIYDISDQDVDTFYAVVGLTNAKGKNGNSEGVIFQVYGDKGNGQYTLLGMSDVIKGYDHGEMRVNIKGVRKLKLVVEAAGAVTSCGCAWGGACIYKADPNAEYTMDGIMIPEYHLTKEAGPGYTVNIDGLYTELPRDGVYYVSDFGPGKIISFVTPNNNGSPRTIKRDVNWAEQQIVLGPQAQTFGKGVSLVVSLPKKDPNFMICDVSELGADRFYSAAGMTGSASKEGHVNYGKYGVIFFVYGSKEITTSSNPEDYELISNSCDIYCTDTGEFDLDIRGYKTLLLQVLPTEKYNYGCEAIWANACVYKLQGNFEPDRGKHYDDDGYTDATEDGFAGIKGEVTGEITFLSDIKMLNSSNVVTAKHKNGEPTTLDHPYNDKSGVIRLGADANEFEKGLGMSPKNHETPVNGSIESWTTFNIRSIECTDFYAAVGLTDEAAEKSEGVIFRLFGDYKGLGNYELLCESDYLTGKQVGEFNVDISSVKALRLVAVSKAGEPAGSDCAWANACIFTAEPEAETDGGGLPLGLIIGAGGGAAALIAGAVIFFIAKKKKKKEE